MAAPTSDIVLTGMLKKLKTMKKKLFVLREESACGPARLEYYDNEKKFRSGHLPKRTIPMSFCFSINAKKDAKHKHVLAIYTKDDCVSLVCESAEELGKWMTALQDLQNDLMFEHVWPVTLKEKGLASGKYCSSGPYRLCLTNKDLSFIRQSHETPDIVFQLGSIRRCGHRDCFFFMELGRSAKTGAGELWMQVEDTVIAQNMHETILSSMTSPSANADQPRPRQRTRSSTEKSTKPVNITARTASHQSATLPTRSKTISGEHHRSPTHRRQSHSPSKTIIQQSRSPASSLAGSPFSWSLMEPHRQRTDSMESRGSRGTSSSLSADEFDAGHFEHSRNPSMEGSVLSVTPAVPTTKPNLDQYMPMTLVNIRDSHEEGGYMDMNPGGNVQTSRTSKVPEPLPEEYVDMSPGTPGTPIAESSYLDMNPGSTSTSSAVSSGSSCHEDDTQYFDMTPACHSLPKCKSSNVSADGGYLDMYPSSQTSKPPSMTLRPDKVCSFLVDDGSLDRLPKRAYSVGSKPTASKSKPLQDSYLDMGDKTESQDKTNSKTSSAPHLPEQDLFDLPTVTSSIISALSKKNDSESLFMELNFKSQRKGSTDSGSHETRSRTSSTSSRDYRPRAASGGAKDMRPRTDSGCTKDFSRLQEYRARTYSGGTHDLRPRTGSAGSKDLRPWSAFHESAGNGRGKVEDNRSRTVTICQDSLRPRTSSFGSVDMRPRSSSYGAKFRDFLRRKGKDPGKSSDASGDYLPMGSRESMNSRVSSRSCEHVPLYIQSEAAEDYMSMHPAVSESEEYMNTSSSVTSLDPKAVEKEKSTRKAENAKSSGQGTLESTGRGSQNKSADAKSNIAESVGEGEYIDLDYSKPGSTPGKPSIPNQTRISSADTKSDGEYSQRQQQNSSRGSLSPSAASNSISTTSSQTSGVATKTRSSSSPQKHKSPIVEDCYMAYSPSGSAKSADKKSPQTSKTTNPVSHIKTAEAQHAKKVQVGAASSHRKRSPEDSTKAKKSTKPAVESVLGHEKSSRPADVKKTKVDEHCPSSTKVSRDYANVDFSARVVTPTSVKTVQEMAQQTSVVTATTKPSRLQATSSATSYTRPDITKLSLDKIQKDTDSDNRATTKQTCPFGLAGPLKEKPQERPVPVPPATGSAKPVSIEPPFPLDNPPLPRCESHSDRLANRIVSPGLPSRGSCCSLSDARSVAMQDSRPKIIRSQGSACSLTALDFAGMPFSGLVKTHSDSCNLAKAGQSERNGERSRHGSDGNRNDSGEKLFSISPRSSVGSEKELNYATLDLQESGGDSCSGGKPIDKVGACIESPLEYAQIDFAKSESLQRGIRSASFKEMS